MTTRQTCASGIADQRGQALIETAMVLPPFLFLIFGIFGFGLVLFGWCNITYASRAAARYASLHSNTSLVPATTSTITTIVAPFLIATDPSATKTTVTYSSTNVIGATVKVVISAKYGVMMPFTSYTSFLISSTVVRTITR